MEVGWCDGLDPFLCSWAPAPSRFEYERDEAWVVVVAGALLCFAFFGGCGVVVGAAGGACGAVTHSVCYADINEILPVVDGGDDVHDCFAVVAVGVGVV